MEIGYRPVSTLWAIRKSTPWKSLKVRDRQAHTAQQTALFLFQGSSVAWAKRRDAIRSPSRVALAHDLYGVVPGLHCIHTPRPSKVWGLGAGE